MFKTPAMRLSIALVLLTVNLLFLANLIGFVPDESESALELRKKLSESLALQFSSACRNEAQRIDRQLSGRCARQGDPGSHQAILSLEDELSSESRFRVNKEFYRLKN